ncbi:MAG: methyltransferase [Clostridia bacterium]|nr:methyltransferase [Clostridia bacterium]
MRSLFDRGDLREFKRMKKLEYLDENLKIYQDDDYYTFTSDSILLSRFAAVKRGDVVADFCAGCGVVGFNLYALNPDKISSVTFFELQKPLLSLCEENIALNGLSDKFFAVSGRVQDISKEYYGKFSLIVCNPPYAKKDSGEKSPSETLAVAKSESALELRELLFIMSRALKFGGRVNFVHRADRLAEIFSLMKEFKIEPKKLCPVAAKGKEPYLVLIEGVKGGRAGLKFLKTIYN